jgi:uncharacterized membrane protein
MEAQVSKSSKALIAPGIFLGLGFSGFIDGIVLHQILQWHHMLSNVRPLFTVADIDLNMVWDGLFHVFDLTMTVIGVILLWRAGEREDVIWAANTFFGSILVGAGMFDVIEGIIDHQILGIHHVKPGPNQLNWDLAFLAFGAILTIVGIVVQKTEKKS